MKNMKRAQRRHHYQRIKRARAGYWSGYAAQAGKPQGMVAASPCRCSGPCCGNPRHHFGEATVQERRQGSFEDSALMAVGV